MNSLNDCLSEKEGKIYAVLKAGAPTSIDRIAKALSAGLAPIPEATAARKAATNGIKAMGGKLAQFGLRIRMLEGGRGRGAKGVYILERIK